MLWLILLILLILFVIGGLAVSKWLFIFLVILAVIAVASYSRS